MAMFDSFTFLTSPCSSSITTVPSFLLILLLCLLLLLVFPFPIFFTFQYFLVPLILVYFLYLFLTSSLLILCFRPELQMILVPR
jgi:hypothetical protein